MFLRTKDDVKILQNENSYISFMKHEEAEKVNRKWNSVQKFKITDNAVNYFQDRLICRMIPKHQIDALKDVDVKMIIAGSHILIYQDFNEYPCKFLVIDDATGYIQTIDFFDIQPDVTEIFCYDECSKSDYLCTVNFAFLFTPEENSHHDIDIHQFKDQNRNLSNYLIFTEQRQGLIINNIFII